MRQTVTELAFCIIEELAKDIKKAQTINQIAKRVNKAYPNVYTTTKHLIDLNILRKEIVGKAHLCRLNLDNPTTLLYISLVKAREFEQRSNPTIQQKYPQDSLLVWNYENQKIQITHHPQTDSLTLADFLNKKNFWDICSKGTLLKGHAHYPTLLQQRIEKEVLK
jgi:hypothetical protein